MERQITPVEKSKLMELFEMEPTIFISGDDEFIENCKEN